MRVWVVVDISNRHDGAVLLNDAGMQRLHVGLASIPWR